MLGGFFIGKEMAGFTPKKLAVIALVASVVAAGVVWASNNVDAVEDTIG
ncbi:conserved hypothetical protein [Vibrio crassostreae]|nr:conserved hypothetical protein [Vibrio crassostreae]CAK1796646.1 conserved hypothetical protein [Vibrio crassostreae]CAK2661674.1 conserved hypothetical protein [Vibrio crassostreae]CAK3159160.1 conserved hypothetical protein [Vibrio crassostreae]CAK3801721.1 conserved hypothetical protein [Vibrio crassostreae]